MRDRQRFCALAFRLPCDALLPLVDNPMLLNAAIGVGRGVNLAAYPSISAAGRPPGYLQKCAISSRSPPRLGKLINWNFLAMTGEEIGRRSPIPAG